MSLRFTRLLTSTATYKADIASFTDSKASLSNTVQLNQDLLNNELKPQLAALRLELRDVEAEWSGLEDKHIQEQEEREAKIEGEIEQLQQQERALLEAAERQSEELREKRERLDYEFLVRAGVCVYTFW